jgi:hypothetical protein
VRHDAVEAIVRARGRDDDHLAFGFAKPALLQHEGVVVREEGPEFVRPMRQGQEDVGNESRLLLHLEHPRADVVGQIFEFRDGIAAD